MPNDRLNTVNGTLVCKLINLVEIFYWVEYLVRAYSKHNKILRSPVDSSSARTGAGRSSSLSVPDQDHCHCQHQHRSCRVTRGAGVSAAIEFLK